MLRVNVVADRLNVTEAYVRQLIRTGKLEAVRISVRGYRVRSSSLDAFLEAGRVRKKKKKNV